MMVPGTLLFDKDFKFHDGVDGKKILIVLGLLENSILLVKTTSKGSRYLNTFGCQSNHRFPNFHLVQGCCCLSKPTWVCLNEFYELNYTALLEKHALGKINRFGILPNEIVDQLCQCALESDDINGKQRVILQSAYTAFLSQETPK